MGYNLSIPPSFLDLDTGTRFVTAHLFTRYMIKTGPNPAFENHYNRSHSAIRIPSFENSFVKGYTQNTCQYVSKDNKVAL